jgi:3-deoxy-7-phosphoheptulonate synthase
MLLVLKPDVDQNSQEYLDLIQRLNMLDGITFKTHHIKGAIQELTEIYLLGSTHHLDADEMRNFPLVDQAIKISRPYKVLGRHDLDTRNFGFTYNGIDFNQDTFHLFAGLCAVNTREHTEAMMKLLKEHHLPCTRMGAYKPRTSPYSFQGHGKACLPYVFELAGKYDIKVIAMEITHDTHIEEIDDALNTAGRPTGVMLQIGTRNTQNFELLKAVGRQTTYPVLFKRGFGITLEESLLAAEYLASEGNSNVIFALRGMKTNMGDPHRNFVDFAHVPRVKALTRMPVCIDPSHSVGSRDRGPEGILDLFHATAQGIIAGANMVLVDFHPAPGQALVDGPQALTFDEFPYFMEDIAIAREAFNQRVALAKRYS